MDKSALTAVIYEKGEFSIAFYTLQGALIGACTGKGPGKCRIHFRPVAAGTYLVKLSIAGRCSFEELIACRN
jgi:hypothetical protein